MRESADGWMSNDAQTAAFRPNTDFRKYTAISSDGRRKVSSLNAMSFCAGRYVVSVRAGARYRSSFRSPPLCYPMMAAEYASVAAWVNLCSDEDTRGGGGGAPQPGKSIDDITGAMDVTNVSSFHVFVHPALPRDLMALLNGQRGSNSASSCFSSRLAEDDGAYAVEPMCSPSTSSPTFSRCQLCFVPAPVVQFLLESLYHRGFSKTTNTRCVRSDNVFEDATASRNMTQHVENDRRESSEKRKRSSSDRAGTVAASEIPLFRFYNDDEPNVLAPFLASRVGMIAGRAPPDERDVEMEERAA